jgi:hypothetical protein
MPKLRVLFLLWLVWDLGKVTHHMPAKIVIAMMLSVCCVPANTFLFATPAGAKDPFNNNPLDVTAFIHFHGW